MYFFILLFIVFIAIISLKIFKQDILSPSFISAIAFAFSFICAIVGMFSWNYVRNLEITTILIFILGIFFFFYGEYLCRKIFFKNHKEISTKELNSKKKYNLVKISRPILILMLIFAIITTSLLISEIIRVCREYGFQSSSFKDILAYYRTKSSLFSSDAYTSTIKVNFIVKQMQKVCNVINITLAVYSVNKLFNIKSIKKINIVNFLLILITIIICLLQTVLFNGGRSIMFHFIVGYIGIFMFYYFIIYKRKFNRKILYSSIILLVSIVGIYYLMLPLLGRSTKHDFIKYSTFSFGTPISSLNLYIQQDDSHSKKIGEETFTGVYYTLNKIGVIEYTEPQTHEWYSYAPGGTLSSNTFTSLRSYYKDFGLCGVIILQFIFGFLITLFYLKMKYSNLQLLHIIYFNYFYILIEQIRDEQFFSLFNISNVANLLIIITIYIVLILLQERRIKHEQN